MLIPNTNVWETRIQNVDALLTAAGGGRREVYYLATVCQVGTDPPTISISPNPEYPICGTIEAAGFFGVNFLRRDQGQLIERCATLERGLADKLGALEVGHERTENGTPLLTDCLQSLECRVEKIWDSGDHRTFVASVIDRRVRGDLRQPRRFRGGQSQRERLTKQILCKTRIYDLAMAARTRLHPPVSIEEGTRRFIGAPAAARVATPAAAIEATPAAAIEATPAATIEATPAATPAGMPVAAPDAGSARRGGHAAPSPPGICLVGCGWWGAVHALELKALDRRARRFFASRDGERARAFARRFDGDDAFDSLEAALADPRVHAVVLALPHHLHAETVRAALSAGKHVLVEKPLCLRPAEGDELVRAAAAAGLCLAVAEQYRLSPLVRAARRLVRGGALGRIGLVHAGVAGNFRPAAAWKQRRETMGGGVLLDVGVHYVDVLRSWFGEPELVWSVTPPHLHEQLEGEDTITAVLRFPDGPIADLSITWSGFRAPEQPNLELIGERGSLALSFKHPYLVHTTPLPGGHWSRRLAQRLPWRVEQHLRHRLPQARRRRIPVPGGDLIGSRALIEDFVLAITTGAEPAVSGAEGLRDLRVVAAAYEALASGRPVPLAPDRAAA